MPAPRILAADLNTNGIDTWVVGHIVPILILVVGVYILTLSKKGNVAKAMTSTGIMILGLVIIGGSALWLAFGTTIANTIVG